MDNNQVESAASAAVSEMFEGQVAFFNIGKKHAFFLCSPDEARHAMDCVRQWRDKRTVARALMASRDAFKAEMVAGKAWEHIPSSRHVVSIGGSLSLSALNQAFATVEIEFKTNDPVVDIIVVGAIRHADIRCWGATVCIETSTEEKKERGVYARVFGADVYLDNTLPHNIVLVGSIPCKEWNGMCSKVEVALGS